MLDFSTRKQKIMDLKLKDGTLLQLIVPRAKAYDEIIDLKNTGKHVQIIPNTTKILNQNAQDPASACLLPITTTQPFSIRLRLL